MRGGDRYGIAFPDVYVSLARRDLALDCLIGKWYGMERVKLCEVVIGLLGDFPCLGMLPMFIVLKWVTFGFEKDPGGVAYSCEDVKATSRLVGLIGGLCMLTATCLVFFVRSGNLGAE